MVTEQRKTLLKLQWNKQQGHLQSQCHSELVTKVSSQCSLALAFHFIQTHSLAVSDCELCVCVYCNGAKGVAN